MKTVYKIKIFLPAANFSMSETFDELVKRESWLNAWETFAHEADVSYTVELQTITKYEVKKS